MRGYHKRWDPWPHQGEWRDARRYVNPWPCGTSPNKADQYRGYEHAATQMDHGRGHSDLGISGKWADKDRPFTGDSGA